eukprot:1208671-Prymnesium_polylepis.1
MSARLHRPHAIALPRLSVSSSSCWYRFCSDSFLAYFWYSSSTSCATTHEASSSSSAKSVLRSAISDAGADRFATWLMNRENRVV